MSDNVEDNSPQGIYTFFQEDAIECAASYPEEIEEALCLWVNTKSAQAQDGEREERRKGALRAFVDLIRDDHDHDMQRTLEGNVLSFLEGQCFPPADIELDAAMNRVIAIAKSYRADESAGGNYKGANESNRKAIAYAEKLLAARIGGENG